ncbi:urea ABC transporter permease subunit UrtC [Uruburuella testudinis]|uniref:Urea ABC transporter permease subunit UrtC n=1 Tax=Uruburuella testudinis TaxID=1282863 RepID=A0ABY4DSS3_9NEIS|nr:urea ABC transporter permease subunit UrtC [Uruburuella testudinis]UOO82085.1 urea ABC transporter permease subunit UrtC [Uruburuella testudinis]
MSRSPLFTLLQREPLLGKITVALLLALLVVVPVGNLLIPAGSALHISTYTVTLLGKYLTYALLALALDLAWGYLGILSLGHGAFFALGGYAMGMYLMREIGDRGAYANANLPDFMVFLGWTELPWFWAGSEYFAWALLMMLFVPGLLAFILGWLCFRSRVSGVYLSIITQAMTYALMLAFYRNEMGFGGNNGLTDFKDILGFSLQSDHTRVALFAVSGITVLAVYAFLRSIMHSRLGKLIVAVRDAEMRTRFVGFRVEHIKLLVFVLSAMIAGLAGALYVPQVGIINPSEFAPLASIEIIIWVALGGRATLYGAIIGAFVVNYAKTWLTAAFPDAWLFFLGALFVLVTIFLKEGIAGLVKSRRAPRNDDDTPSETDSAKQQEAAA